MSEKLGICDVATHANGWVTIAPGVRHERLAGCVNWREPVASPQATRQPCNVGVVVDDRIKPCTLDHGHYGKHHADLAAQPAAGTTPREQALEDLHATCDELVAAEIAAETERFVDVKTFWPYKLFRRVEGTHIELIDDACTPKQAADGLRSIADWLLEDLSDGK